MNCKLIEGREMYLGARFQGFIFLDWPPGAQNCQKMKKKKNIRITSSVLIITYIYIMNCKVVEGHEFDQGKKFQGF